MISQRRAGVAKYYLFEPLGTARTITDGSQAISDTYILTAFGEPVALSGSTINPFRYLGNVQYYYELDCSLYSVRRRLFNPAIGAWLSVDPARRGASPGPIRVWSSYNYADNNPLVISDPSGLQSKSFLCILVAELCLYLAKDARTRLLCVLSLLACETPHPPSAGGGGGGGVPGQAPCPQSLGGPRKLDWTEELYCIEGGGCGYYGFNRKGTVELDCSGTCELILQCDGSIKTVTSGAVAVSLGDCPEGYGVTVKPDGYCANHLKRRCDAMAEALQQIRMLGVDLGLQPGIGSENETDAIDY